MIREIQEVLHNVWGFLYNFPLLPSEPHEQGAAMRLDWGGSHIVLVWTDNQYRHEIARLCQGINTSTIKLIRARQFLGLRLVVLRRVRTIQEAASTAPSNKDPRTRE